MLKLLGIALVLLSIGALGVGIAGIAVNAWDRDWRGLAMSAVVLALGMAFADSGRYLVFRHAE
jgi:hypothetical protein